MSSVETITSLQNPRIKNVVRLGNRRHRDQLHQTVVEGIRESTQALHSGVVPVEAFICREYLDASAGQTLIATLTRLAGEGRTRLFEVSAAVFDKMAYRRGSGGILMVIPYHSRTLADLSPGDLPLILIVDGAEKPGNLGAILRTADAAGVGALLITDTEPAGTDAHNPNVIRASLGAYFFVPVVTATQESALRWLREQGIRTVAATPQAQQDYTEASYIAPTAIVMGSEAFGLSESWLEHVDDQVRIPMSGRVDSLNLSVATAVILYEALRQRKYAMSGSAQAGNGA